MISILSNINGLVAQRALSMNRVALTDSLNRLATGQRINRGADDPAGLIASESMRSTLASLQAESDSLQRTDAVASTADGALGQVSDLLNQANTLALANANTAGLSDQEKQANQIQINAIVAAVDRMGSSTQFNGAKLLDGSTTLSAMGRAVTLPDTSAGSLGQTNVSGTDYTLADVVTGGPLDTSAGNSENAQQVIGAAINQVATLRAQIGSLQSNTIAPRMNTIATSMENASSADSSIRDTDFAAEASRSVRAQILQMASMQTMRLVGASSRSVLSLLG